MFLNKTTKKLTKARKSTAHDPSRRAYSFFYYLEVKGELIRVCRDFFLGTLNISQKPVYTAHLDENKIKKDMRGKGRPKNFDEKKGRNKGSYREFSCNRFALLQTDNQEKILRSKFKRGKNI